MFPALNSLFGRGGGVALVGTGSRPGFGTGVVALPPATQPGDLLVVVATGGSPPFTASGPLTTISGGLPPLHAKALLAGDIGTFNPNNTNAVWAVYTRLRNPVYATAAGQAGGGPDLAGFVKSAGVKALLGFTLGNSGATAGGTLPAPFVQRVGISQSMLSIWDNLTPETYADNSTIHCGGSSNGQTYCGVAQLFG